MNPGKSARAMNCAGLYRYPFDAQLNECDNVPACGAATYSVIGTQLAPCAPNNTSSRTAKRPVKARFCAIFVLEMTSNTSDVHDT